MNELQTLYLKMLEKMWSVEDQLVGALPKMIEMANSEMLKTGLTDHLEETKDQKARLEEIFRAHGHSPSMETDTAFQTLLRDAEAELATVTDLHVRDALIIASAQTVEHIEMARYGALIEWADELDDDTGENLLKESLKEEEAADKKLTSVAEGGILRTGVNEKAAE